MIFVYILYSSVLDRYYIGMTEDVDRRIEEHNTAFFKDSFTRRASDWTLYHKIECESRKQAAAIETHVKRMKSRKYIENLRNYPEIVEKLKLRY